ncbi:MAG: hypothetical protein AB8G17_02880 [Gammaproteobacteria bacterium]
MRCLLLALGLMSALTVAADELLNDEAFFEFLGSFDEVDEAWIDPLWLADDALVDVDDEISTTTEEDPDES